MKNYQDFDYLLKADDDTFVIVDNLLALLSIRSPLEEFLLGHEQTDQGVTYLSGGSGYVISKAAFERIVPAFQYQCYLPHASGQEIEIYPNEDLQMGKCAQLLNIKLYSSQIDGQSTFLPFR